MDFSFFTHDWVMVKGSRRGLRAGDPEFCRNEKNATRSAAEDGIRRRSSVNLRRNSGRGQAKNDGQPGRANDGGRDSRGHQEQKQKQPLDGLELCQRAVRGRKRAAPNGHEAHAQRYDGEDKAQTNEPIPGH